MPWVQSAPETEADRSGHCAVGRRCGWRKPSWRCIGLARPPDVPHGARKQRQAVGLGAGQHWPGSSCAVRLMCDFAKRAQSALSIEHNESWRQCRTGQLVTAASEDGGSSGRDAQVPLISVELSTRRSRHALGPAGACCYARVRVAALCCSGVSWLLRCCLHPCGACSAPQARASNPGPQPPRPGWCSCGVARATVTGRRPNNGLI